MSCGLSSNNSIRFGPGRSNCKGMTGYCLPISSEHMKADQSNTEMWDRHGAGAASSSNPSESTHKRYWGFGLVAFALVVLLGAELVLIIRIPGGNYGGADGKAAHAAILATLEFARAFDISNLDPLQGMGSEMTPMNVLA